MTWVRRKCDGFAWLEMLIALAVLSLVLQLAPSLRASLIHAIDVRNWSSVAWFAVNAVFLLILCLIKYGPDYWADMRDRSGKRRRVASGNACAAERKREAAAKREMLQGIRDSRRRRMW